MSDSVNVQPVLTVHVEAEFSRILKALPAVLVNVTFKPALLTTIPFNPTKAAPILTLNGPVCVNVASPAAAPKVNWQAGKTTGVVVPALLEVQVAVVES
jgi:hypothetical protein